MGRVYLISSGLRFESDKQNIKLKWKQPLVGFHKPTPTNMTIQHNVDEWISVYKNHLEFYLKGTPEDSPGFKFGEVGITDSHTEFTKDQTTEYEITYLVVNGKIIRQQISKEPKTRDSIFPDNVCLYLEGPDRLTQKFFGLIRKAMENALELEN